MEYTDRTLRILACVVQLLALAQGFSFGAPTGTCWTMYPKHSNIPRQSSPSPFTVTLSPQKYSPGELITVTIAAPDRRNFTGFQIGAHRQTENTEEIVGQFTDYPGDKVTVFTCFGGFKNMATHWNSKPTDSIALGWQAPPDNVGNVSFLATVVADYSTFWIDVTAELSPQDESLAVAAPFYPAIPLQTNITDIDLSSCGESKGCFLYPRHCSDTDCLAAVTYEYREDTKDVRMELYTDAADIFNYISVALSEDTLMGHYDETFTCVSNHGEMSVQQGYNPEYHNGRMFTRFISDTKIKHSDGRLHCSFTVPLLTEIYSVNQETPQFQYKTTPISLERAWYLQLAWGDAMPGSDVIAYHKEMPPVTDDPVDVRKVKVERGSAYHILVHVHVVVMVIAWVFLTGLLSVVSRHYKQWYPKKTWCGTKIWFQIHREMALLVVALTAVGLFCVFYHYGSEIRKFAVPHAYVGLAVTAGVGVQVLMGFLRPGGDHKLRPLYNWGHFALGHLTHITAAVTMFLAYDIEHINRDMRRFGYVTLSVWLVVQVLWYLVFEILSWRQKKAKSSDSYAIETVSKDLQIAEKDGNVHGDCRHSLLFTIYVVCLAAVCIAVSLSFNLY
ncbi:putative ferric-chelate reductase 1 homolog [Aplysia californica]|uniref:Ferric-chelate reductase 1 homolog n=1 Tax=Aplysia californica TaxID=6500 RepID=A0ABM1A7Z6_APLCA|nr:putative ferric-chelate reductase 1 homolog [Aplysia californica]